VGVEGREKMGGDQGGPRVLVVHPGGYFPAYQAALAADEAGVLWRFVTGVYDKPGTGLRTVADHLPTKLAFRLGRQLRRRYIGGLSPNRISSAGWLEITRLALQRSVVGKVIARHYGTAGITKGYSALFDRYAAGYVRSASANVVLAYQGGGLHVLRAARRYGMATLVDQAASLNFGRIVADEHERVHMTGGIARPNMGRLLEEVALADGLLAPSEFVRASLVERGVPERLVHIVPFGVDVERFTPAVASEENGRQFTALFVGQITLRKGVHYLLDAWQKLSLPNAKLILIGGVTDSAGWRVLERYRGIYTWLPDVPNHELHAHYKDADIFVLPTLAEGSALVTYEALACGLPCVVTHNAGSIVRDGEEGFVIPIRDVTTLQAAIHTLWASRELRVTFARAARKRAEEFTWERYRRAVRSVYEHVSGEVPARRLERSLPAGGLDAPAV
jgi:alpha-maltose-1-phosphate synthase